MTDHFAQDEPHALAITRNIFANLNLRNQHTCSSATSSGSSNSDTPAYDPNWDEPLYDSTELRGAVPSDTKTPWDVRAVLGRILDGSRFEEFKSNYGKTLVTGEDVWRCLCASGCFPSHYSRTLTACQQLNRTTTLEVLCCCSWCYAPPAPAVRCWGVGVALATQSQ